nr:hypothetical protein [Tanacetum cinerariifolium]
MAGNAIAAGAALMLEKGVYDSWKTHIWLYIKAKDNGEMLIDSIKNGPFQLKEEITVPVLMIWDRVKELMKGTELTLQEHESKLYDEFDRLTYDPRELIHLYYWRYAKLINAMNIIKMTMTPIQVNTKFVNHLQLEWSSFHLQIINSELRKIQELKLLFMMAELLLITFKDVSLRVLGLTLERVKLHERRCQQYHQDFLAARLEEMDDDEDLQLHTTLNFKVDHIDTYDSVCDDEATASTIFMASLSLA